MKQNEFIHLIENPAKAASDEIARLIDLKKQFPFFQSAHMLLTLVSKKYDSSIYQQTLKQTAISIPNRAWLHNLLNAPEASEIPAVAEIQKQDTHIVQPAEVEAQIKAEEKVEAEPTEIEHIKAIELSSADEKVISKEEKLNELVEKEVQKDIINAFIEKEVLKTPDWYKKEKNQEEEKVSETKQVEKQEEVKENITAGTFSD